MHYQSSWATPWGRLQLKRQRGVDVGASPFDITQWMTAETVRAYEAACRRRTFRSGEILYLQGDRGTEMYQVLSGSIKLSVIDRTGREVSIAFFERGACFGDSSLIDNGPRPQTAKARTDCDVAVLGIAEFHALRESHRDFDTALLRLLAVQMRSLGENLARTNLDSVESRVIQAVLSIAWTAGNRQPDGMRLGRRLSQNDLASAVGVSRQSVNKLLQRLQRAQLIRIEYGNILITDENGLRQLVEGHSNN